MKKALINTKSHIPIIEFSIPDVNQKFYALVDTGAEITMANKSFVEKNNIKTEVINTKLKVVGIDSKKTYNNAILAQVPVVFDDKVVTLKVPLCDLTPIEKHFISFHDEHIEIALLLGSDFLNEFKANIDYSNQLLKTK